ncbi:CoA-disulfide reductase [Enterococcus durans]|uniref:CoA-disulfide reductase n=1 Tax=Enterococcus durans TaxID=53345 RepID=UPI003D6A8CDD
MKIVIIGGIAAGMSAAAKAKRLDPSTEIIVIEQEEYVSFGACGLPYYLGEEFSDENEMFARTPEQIERLGIRLLLKHKVQALDSENKRVLVEDLATNERFYEKYDRLMLAVGASPLLPAIAGSDSKDVYTATKLSEINRFKQALPSYRKITIVGGGFIGLELADQLVKTGNEVHIIETKTELMNRTFDQEFSEKIAEAIQEKGVNLHLGESVVAIEQQGGRVHAIQTSKQRYETDAVLFAIGFAPNTSFLDGQLDCLENGAIRIDTYGRTSQKDIFAAGDCASIPHRLLGDVYLPLATTANKMGRIVGINISSEKVTEEYVGALGSSAIKIGDYEAASVGLTEKTAQQAKMDYSTTCVEVANHSNYYSVQEKIKIKLVYDKQTKVVYGAQLFGKNETVLRSTGLAVAIHGQMTTKELEFIDFAYAPPFASTWEAINVVANTAK